MDSVEKVRRALGCAEGAAVLLDGALGDMLSFDEAREPSERVLAQAQGLVRSLECMVARLEAPLERDQGKGGGA